MEDRLAEFMEPGVQVKTVTPSLMPEFSSKIKVLQQSINQVKYNNVEIIRLKNEIVAATMSEQEKRLSFELDKFVELNKAICTKVQTELRNLQSEINQDKINNPDEPETRIKIIGYQAFSNKFAEILKEYQKLQLEYKDAIKAKLSRQAKQINENLSEEQVQEMINNPEALQRMFSDQLIGAPHVKVQNAISDIQDRYNDIKKLEKNVQVIHQMFVDLALLVQQQGLIIDSIEINLHQAQDYVKKAGVKLKEAKQNHEQAKKWKWLVMLILLIIAIIVIFVVIRP